MVLHHQEFVRELISKDLLGGRHTPSPGTDFPLTPFGYLDDQWDVEDMGNRLAGHTDLNNFDMEAYFKHIGIREDAVIWKEY